MKNMKLRILKAALLVATVSVTGLATGPQAYAASDAENMCLDNLYDADSNHPCRSSLKTQEGYKQNSKYMQCIIRMKKECSKL